MKKRRKATVCFNCDNPLLNSENFCSTCGQENNSKQASFRQLSKDFMGDFLSFDSRLFSSIVPLVIHPGQITMDYLDGKRQRFIPPFRVFLFLSFLYFGLSFLIDKDSGAFQFTSDGSEEAARKVFTGFVRNFNLIILLYIPAFALLVRLLFKSKQRNYFVNFFVYTLHLFSFFFILGMVQILLFYLFELTLNESMNNTASTVVQIIIFIGILLYSVISLKRVFKKRYTILRFCVVLISSLIVFSIFIFSAVLLLIAINR